MPDEDLEDAVRASLRSSVWTSFMLDSAVAQQRHGRLLTRAEAEALLEKTLEMTRMLFEKRDNRVLLAVEKTLWSFLHEALQHARGAVWE